MRMSHRDYIKNKLLKTEDHILEFGPLNGPIATKDRFKKARYADIRSTDDIKKLYTANTYLESTGIKINTEDIVDIDYVVKGTYKDTFKKVPLFDAVVLSHVIEHMPDIINFFTDIKSVISPDGKIIIIYPDARYCFDHFRNGTSFIDAYEVYKDNRNSRNRVFDFVYNAVHENRPSFFWSGTKSANILPKNGFKDALSAYRDVSNNKLPDDTHFWPFSDYQFIKFLYDLDRAELLDFDIEFFSPTKENTQEFMIVLKPKKEKKIDYKKYKSLLKSTSPISMAANSLSKIRLLESELEKSELEKSELFKTIKNIKTELTMSKSEIDSIYNSKRWIYSSKIASIKHRFALKNNEKK